MPTPHSIGDKTEAIVLAQLLQVYDSVLIPFGNGRRYDLVIEEAGKFTRVQCKTGRLRNGVVIFNTHSIGYVAGGRRSRGYRGDADLFGVYCPDTKRVYLVPVDEVPVDRGFLRVTPARSGQQKNVRLAEQYELRTDDVAGESA